MVAKSGSKKRVKTFQGTRMISTTDVTIGEVRCDRGTVIGPRYQRNYQLLLIFSGRCTAVIDDQINEHIAGRTSIFYPNHREQFTFRLDDKAPHYAWCHIRPGFMPPSLVEKLKDSLYNPPFSETSRQIINTAFTLRPPLNDNACSILNNLAVSLFFEYCNVEEERKGWMKHDTAILTAAQYMEAHFAEKNCLQAAINASGMSRRAIIYRFKDKFGTTPDNYLWKLRTEKGVALLGETGLSIPEIAARCGFKNPKHFSREVNEFHGAPPGAVRSKSWLGK